MEKESSIQFVELSNKRKYFTLGICYDEEIKETRFDLRESLISFLAEEALDDVVAILKKEQILLRIETPRKESLGICYLTQKTICINNDLNKDRFLSVFIHEYAHLLTYLNFPKAPSHGIEFYYSFQEIVLKFIEKNIIHKDMFLPIVNRSGNYAFYEKYRQFIFDLSTIRIGNKAIYMDDIILRGKGSKGLIDCTRVSDNKKLKLDKNTKVKPVIDLNR